MPPAQSWWNSGLVVLDTDHLAVGVQVQVRAKPLTAHLSFYEAKVALWWYEIMLSGTSPLLYLFPPFKQSLVGRLKCGFYFCLQCLCLVKRACRKASPSVVEWQNRAFEAIQIPLSLQFRWEKRIELAQIFHFAAK